MTTVDAAIAAGPCHNCRHYERCTAERQCFEALVIFARHGERCSPARWSVAPRFSSRDILERLKGSLKRSAAAMRERQAELKELGAEVARRRAR